MTRVHGEVSLVKLRISQGGVLLMKDLKAVGTMAESSTLCEGHLCGESRCKGGTKGRSTHRLCVGREFKGQNSQVGQIMILSQSLS